MPSTMLRLGLMAVTLLVSTAGLLAKLPGSPGEPPDTKPWGALIIGSLLTGLVCVGLWKSAKRTHQD